MQAHTHIAGVERDVAAMAGISAVEAAVEKEAERVQRAQRIVVGAEIAGTKGDRLGRAGAHQHIRRETDQLFLRPERKIADVAPGRSEEHTSELQSLMRISYAVYCLNKQKTTST